MQGSLKQVPLPEVLQFVSMGKSSGILRLRREKNEITLSVNNGKIINSSAIDRRRRLGDLLVNRGLLKRSELTRLLNLQKTVESDKRLGQILVERDIVSEDTIRDALRLQLEEEIWNLFAWQDGEFSFEQMDPRELGDAIVSIDIEPLILEGTRRNDEWQKILTILPSDRIILEPAPITDDFERHLKLRPHEWQVLSQINGHFTIRAIVNRSNLGRFEVFLILSQFIKTGLLRFKDVEHDQGNGAGTNGHEESTSSRLSSQEQTPLPEKKSGLLGGLLGSGRSRDKSSGKGMIEFVSPIGAMANFLNAFVTRVVNTREFNKTEADNDLVDRIWFDLMQIYTKADLISIKHNTADTKAIETYLRECEFAEYVDEIYEDALEGLVHLLQTSYMVFTQRVGERVTSKSVRELLDDMGGRMAVQYRGPFPIAERIQNVLRIS